MQALTRTLCPCYAAADRAEVERVAAFLDRGADVRVFLDDGEMEPGADLAEKAREARTADLVLVFFSRHSMPSRWPRVQWESALVTEPAAENVRIAFVKCDDCTPPRVLTPLFELNRLRDIKRWVRNVEPGAAPSYDRAADLEVLGLAIADRPGIETVADTALVDEFVEVFRPDFDAILRLSTGDRPLAPMAGDLATQLGLRLEGTLADNLERLRAFCAPRRILIVHEGGEAPHLLFEGSTSTLICEEGGGPSRDPLYALQQVFADPDAAWPALCQAARQTRRVARDMGRIAELYEMMHIWADRAEENEDPIAHEEAMREKIWILEAWGQTEEAQTIEVDRARRYDEQLRLF